MRCEDVQQELARDVVPPALREAVESHISGCPSCRNAQLLFGRIDEALKRSLVWEPPEGFAQRVAAQAPDLARTRRVSRPVLSPAVLNAGIVCFFVIVTGYLGVDVLELLATTVGSVVSDRLREALDAYERFIEIMSTALVTNAVPVAWACAGLSLWLAMRSMRRILPE